MLYFIIYILQVLPTLSDIAYTVCVLSFVFSLVLGLGCIINGNEDPLVPTLLKTIKILGITCCISTLLALFTPNQTTLYQMSAVYLGKQVNQSIQLDAKIQKISTIVDLQLDKAIKDLTSDK